MSAVYNNPQSLSLSQILCELASHNETLIDRGNQSIQFARRAQTHIEELPDQDLKSLIPKLEDIIKKISQSIAILQNHHDSSIHQSVEQKKFIYSAEPRLENQKQIESATDELIRIYRKIITRF